MRNYYISEAAESLKKTDKIKKDLKKKLNTCKLSNFKSEADCSDFYSVFSVMLCRKTIQLQLLNGLVCILIL